MEHQISIEDLKNYKSKSVIASQSNRQGYKELSVSYDVDTDTTNFEVEIRKNKKTENFQYEILGKAISRYNEA